MGCWLCIYTELYINYVPYFQFSYHENCISISCIARSLSSTVYTVQYKLSRTPSFYFQQRSGALQVTPSCMWMLKDILLLVLLLWNDIMALLVVDSHMRAPTVTFFFVWFLFTSLLCSLLSNGDLWFVALEHPLFYHYIFTSCLFI